MSKIPQEGQVLVPVNLTRELGDKMLDAMWPNGDLAHDEAFNGPEEALSAAWSAMIATVPADAARAQGALQNNLRETFEALCTMRNAINEHISLPSLESDLLQGPETSVFCSVVAEAVITALKSTRAQGAEVEPVGKVDASYGTDGMLVASFSPNTLPVGTLLYTTPPAPQPADRERVLEEALLPFAKLAEAYDPDEGDDGDKCWVHEYTPTLGDLRRARAALAGEAPSQTDRAEGGE